MLRTAASASRRAAARAFTTDAAGKVRCTLIPGDGIGPEISDAVEKIFEAADSGITFETVGATPETMTVNHLGVMTSGKLLDSLNDTQLGLKGPLGTPIGGGHVSLNVTLRKTLKLYTNVRPCISIPGVKTQYDDVDIVTMRENTEGEYCGIEQEVQPGVVQSIKLITDNASTRISEAAFDFAVRNGRDTVTCVHKANIMKKADGQFRKSFWTVAEKYPGIKANEMTMDAACLELSRDPTQYDILVMPNLYGDIISDLGSGLVGGLGLTGSGNYGDNNLALFEAVHGTAPDIAGQNLANPTALLFSGCMMLDHVGKPEKAKLIGDAIRTVLAEGSIRTGDLGGSSKCSEYTDAIIAEIKKNA